MAVSVRFSIRNVNVTTRLRGNMRSVPCSRVIFTSLLIPGFHRPRFAIISGKRNYCPYQRFNMFIKNKCIYLLYEKTLICFVIILNITLYRQGYTPLSSNSLSFSSYSIKCSQSSLSISSNCASTSILNRLRKIFDCFFNSSIST